MLKHRSQLGDERYHKWYPLSLPLAQMLVLDEQQYIAVLNCRDYILLMQIKEKILHLTLSWTTCSYYLPGERKITQLQMQKQVRSLARQKACI